MAVCIDIFTLFPEMFTGPMTCSMLQRAQEQGQLTISLYNIRDYTTDKHRTADAPPYGGGGGMIMKPVPLITAVEAVVPQGVPVILLSPQGRVFDQCLAEEFRYT